MNNEFSQYKRDASKTKNVALNDFQKFKRKENKPEENEPGTLRRIAENTANAIGTAIPQFAQSIGRGFADLAPSRRGGMPEITKELYEGPTVSQEIRSAREKSQGFKPGSLEPQGSFEKGAEKFARFVGESPAFGGIEGVRGLLSLGGLAAGSQLGEDQKLGPLGQFATGAVGALLPGGIENLAKGAARAVTSPKQSVAKGVAKLVKAPEIKKQLIEDARKAGVQLDLGSITDSGVVKFVQNQIAQSPLVGDALEVFKKDLSQQVVNEYKSIVDTVGQANFQNNFQAGEAVQNAIKANQQSNLEKIRNLYSNARNAGKDATAPTRAIRQEVSKIRDSLFPGAVKSPEQLTVLSNLEKLEDNLWRDFISVDSLINTKTALNDIIDYEVQGGSKQLLKKVVKSIDDTLTEFGKQHPSFGKEWKSANQEFAQHAKTFRNTNISNVLKTQDPATIFNKMNTTAGIKDIQKALSHSFEGKELFKDLSRYKIDDMIGKALEKNVKEQIQFGTIRNVFKQSKTQEILKELMPKSEFDRLKRLTDLTGNIAESASKFLNTSQSGTTIVNLAAVSKMLFDIGQAFSGNLLPALKSLGGLAGVRGVSNLITDPEFLRAVEDAILVSKSSNVSLMEQAGKNLLEAAQQGIRGIPQILNN